MAIQLPDSERDDDLLVDINTTPLIDVMLVLLIMLIITIPLQTHAVKLAMPPADQAPAAEPPEVVRLVVDFDGTMSWDGTVMPDRASLEQHLRAASVQPNQPEIHLWPNKQVPYGAVAMVLAEAQRLGVVKIGIAGSEQF
jgi:biopolymer transport protein ExbD